MDRFLALLLLFAVTLTVTECTDDALMPQSTRPSSEHVDPDSDSDALQTNACAILNGIQPCASGGATTGCPVKGAPGSSSSGFATPIFGLATAPNGDVFLADAGAGIATRTGALDIPLPNVTDVSPLGRGSLWAITGLIRDPGQDASQGLYRASRGHSRLIADLFDFEEQENPDGASLLDSTPFDVYPLGGRAVLVTSLRVGCQRYGRTSDVHTVQLAEPLCAGQKRIVKSFSHTEKPLFLVDRPGLYVEERLG